MVRKEWKPREGNDSQESMAYRDDEDKMDEDDDGSGDHDSDDDDEDEIASQEEEVEDDEEIPEDEEDIEATPRMLPRTTGIGIHSPQSSISDASSLPPASSRGTRANTGAPSQNKKNNNSQSSSAGVDGLVNSLESLTLVPNSVRFGRGGKTSGFAPNPRGRGRGRARIAPPLPSARSRGEPSAPGPMAVDVRVSAEAGQQDASGQQRVGDIIPVSPDAIPRGRGRGGGGRARAARGRGRGRGA